MENDKLTVDINDWLCKLPRKEFEYVLLLRDKEAERSERLHANTIASLTGENERLRQENYRLRARLQILTGVAVENTTLDALQPKEGEG